MKLYFVVRSCKKDTQSDYVEFSNFNVHLMDRKMRRMCGSKSDNSRNMVISDGNFFRVTFKSNDHYDATGFKAFYQFRKYQGQSTYRDMHEDAKHPGQLAGHFNEKDAKRFTFSLTHFSKRQRIALRLLNAIAIPSVVCLSVCRLSVTLVHPTQAVELFGNFFHHTIAQGL